MKSWSSTLLSVEDFRGKDVNPDTLGSFEMLLEIAAFETERIHSQKRRKAKPCSTASGKPQTSMNQKLLKQSMKATPKQQNRISFAMKAECEIPIHDHVKTQGYEGTSKQDLIIVEPAKQKQHKRKQRAIKNSTVTSELSLESETKVLKRKMKDMSNKEWIEEMKNKKKKLNNPNHPPSPSLPEEFEREIVDECNGTRPNQLTLVIQKPLYNTDLSPWHNRISMPCSQIESFEFLKNEEMTRLRRDEAITVPVIHRPRRNGVPLPLTETPLEFKQWNLHKNHEGRVNPQYVLRTRWKEVVSEGELKTGDEVQIWAYRNAQDRLCMALIKLESDEGK